MHHNANYLAAFRPETLARAYLALLLISFTSVATGDDAEQAFARGDFSAAARLFEDRLAGEGSVPAPCSTYLGLGDSYRLAGRTRRALAYYRRALAPDAPPGCAIRARTGLGMALYLEGDLIAARDSLTRALSRARRAGDPSLTAEALNATAGVLAAGNRFARATRHLKEAATLQGAGPLARAKAHAGLAALALMRGEQADAAIDTALELIATAPDTFLKGQLLLDVADLKSLHRPRAVEATLVLSRTLKNTFLESAALGRAGALAMERGDRPAALTLTRKALFLAQSIQNAELLYLWNWQMGRLETDNSEPEAIRFYALALDAFRLVRDTLIRRYRFAQRDFREAFGSFFLAYASLLLNQSQWGERNLLQARSVIETFKSAELQDYFLDDCVSDAEQGTTLTAEKGTAVVYPIIRGDNLELLVETHDGLFHTSVGIPGRELSARVRIFRRQLQSFRPAYMETARELHDWLITPIRAELANADILVIVPDGALRLMPFAALHDGERFLIERHAIAVTPGMSITISAQTQRDAPGILLVGLTESIQGFKPLPGVSREIESLRRLYGAGARVLLNEQFNAQRMRDLISQEPPGILHLASHASFSGDPRDSFVLTYDDRMDLDELEALVRGSRAADESLTLLTLAACETAMGDDRAALGLAGVAVKAGASSALATLWSVADRSAAELTVAFYAALRNGLGHARALQNAQHALLQNDDYDHPGHWSAFLLIGDWH